MAARQNKKRKGRNSLNRERTVTTLTEGPEGSVYLVPVPREDPPSATSSSATAIMSSPFSVASSSGPNLSPSFQIPNSFAHYNNNSYPNYLAPLLSQQQSPQFFPQSTQQPQVQQQQAMPQGQNDLEVLERLKETIKNNQHEYFKPIPQPAALASVYLGPHPSSSSSRVPPHPEQLPGGQQSLSGNEHDLSSPSTMIDSANTGPGTNGSLPAVGDRRAARPQDGWDNARKQSAPISQDPTPADHAPLVVLSQTSPQPTTPAPPSRYDPGASSKLGNTKDKSMDVDDTGPPPGLGKQLPASSSTLQRGTLGDTRQGDLASKYDYSSTGRSDKPGAGESTSGSANRVTGAQGEPTKEDNNRPARDWPHRNSNASSTMDDPARRSPGPLSNRGPPPSSSLPPSDTRYGDTTSGARDRDSRYYDKDSRDVRDRDRERDRERDAIKPFDPPGRSAWDRDRDRDRDRERDRFDRRPEAGGNVGGRYGRDYDRDRRNDDRFRDTRRPPPDQRHYEPKYTSSGGANEGGLRRYDSKSSVGGNDPPVSNLNSNNSSPPSRVEDRDRDRVPPSDSRGAPRPLARDRSVDASREPLDDRRAYPDDRRPPPGPALDRDRTPRPADDRRPPPPTTTRGPLPPGDERDRRPTEDPIVGRGGVADQVRPPPADDRRNGHPPRPVSPVPPRSGPPENHRAPLATRSTGDRRGSVSGGPQPAPARGPPPTAPGDRRSTGPSGGDDPRRPVPQAQERDAPPKAPAAALPPALDKPRVSVLRERVGFPSNRPSPAVPDDRSSSRPQVPLEDRLARPAPTLQERLSSARADMAHSVSDDRPSRPPPKEERPVIPTGPSVREDPRPPPLAKQSDTPRLPPTGPAASEQSTRAIPDARGSASISKSAIPTEPSRSAPVLSSTAPDRGRPPLADRFSARPVTPTHPAAAPGPPSRAPLGNYSVGPSASRGNSVPREDFKGYPGTNASPTRKTEYRTASRQPQSYDRDRRSDAMDVDTPPPSATRFPGGDRGQPAPASYRRPSTPPYSRSERTWAPQPGDGYPPEAPRGHPTEPRSYERGWGDDERGVAATYGDEWDRRWDRDREREREREHERDTARDRDRERDRERAPAPPPPRDYERDRFVERDSGHPPAWETREERERRAPYGPPDAALPPSTSTSARPYEPRPLSARLTDGYPDDRDRDRDRSRERPYGGRDFERTRYPPDSTSTAPPPFSTSRVRPRSPSPPSRRSGVPPSSSDDLRGPPLKRPREDGYSSGYYPSDSDYTHSRLRSPPPATSGGGGYYDDRGGYTVVSTGHAPLPRDSRDRDYDTRDSYGSYDRRRADTASRMLPPRSPPAYSRPPPSYPRDDGRYMPPPRT